MVELRILTVGFEINVYRFKKSISFGHFMLFICLKKLKFIKIKKKIRFQTKVRNEVFYAKNVDLGKTVEGSTVHE